MSQQLCKLPLRCSRLASRAQKSLGAGRFSTQCPRYQEPRPATAPKQYPDLKAIRADPELYAQNCLLRNYEAHINAPRTIFQLGQDIRTLDGRLREPRSALKQLSKKLGQKLPNDERITVLEEVSRIREDVERLEQERLSCEDTAHYLALGLPNLTSPETPADREPRLIRYINYDPEAPPTFDDTADHSYIGKELSLLDFTSSTATAGWGFYYLLNEAALLEQALIQYALSVALKHGWRAVSPPSLVYSHIADACGFQPRDQSDEQQIWQIAQTQRDYGKPKRSLAATAEIPLAGLYASNTISPASLPVKVAGSSRCYRAEAGARGVDTKGLYRVHEFSKVEMFAWTAANSWTAHDGSPPPSTSIFDEMVAIQTEILTSLNLPCRVLEMPATDLGASAYRKIDIEALFPSRKSRDNGWGEVTSASICTDYQSRRLDTRILEKSGARSAFPHTVNGTAMAIPRVLAAILEHGWRQDHVVIPDVLRTYMGGQSEIRKKS